MDIIKDNPLKLYLRYLFFSFGSALISSLYSVVDMMMVGQYEGESGSAATAIVAPIWNIIYSLGLLTGMGSAIFWAKAKGEGKNSNELNQIFSVGMGLTLVISLVVWILLIVFERQILIMFGATEALIPLAEKYLVSIKFTVPIFLFNQILAAFLRNDNDPSLATVGIICGGLFNVLGDYLFVFTFNLGIEGAGIATVLCNVVSLIIMCLHFFKKKNTLKLVKPQEIFKKSKSIFFNGFSSFFVDTSMGILTIVFNNQILSYFNENALAVYGVIININTFVQCCAYGVGKASQPLISMNFGANNKDRVNKIYKYGVVTIIIISAIWLSSVLISPNGFINLFMNANSEVLSIAPSIMRAYCLVFIFLPFNVFSVYYFQSILKPLFAFIVSALRGLVISVPLLFILPKINSFSIWYAMLITEAIVFIMIVAYMLIIHIKEVKAKDKSLELSKQNL